MKKTIILFIAALVMLVAACDKTQTVAPEAKLHQFTIKEDSVGSKNWFVEEVSSGQRVPIQVNKGDFIAWTTDSSDVQFQFPFRIKKYFKPLSPTVQDNPFNISVTKGNVLLVQVKRDLTNRQDLEFVYSVLVKEDCVFAEGTSPPVIIISNRLAKDTLSEEDVLNKFE